MGGFQYKGKEGVEMLIWKGYTNERSALMGGTLMRGITVHYTSKVLNHNKLLNNYRWIYTTKVNSMQLSNNFQT